MKLASRKIRQIILTQPDDLARSRMKVLLQDQPDFLIAADISVLEATHLAEIFMAVEETPESLVIADFSLNTPHQIQVLAGARPVADILLVNSDMTPHLVCCLLRHGVKGHLHTHDKKSLPEAVLALCEGRCYLSPQISSQLITWLLNSSNNMVQQLSLRDSFLLYFLGKAKTFSELLSVLNISKRTLERRLNKLYSKFFVNDIKALRAFSASFLFKNSR